MKPEPVKANSIAFSVSLFSLAVLLVWFFPSFWFTHTDSGQGYFWLAEQTNVVGWQYRIAPISKTAEEFLVADRLMNGDFTANDGTVIRVFSAKRYAREENEIGLFSHTPDRCWTAVGWKLEPTAPEVVEVPVHGLNLKFERRVFRAAEQRELVYFGALVGGQPLPYRLDQFLASAQQQSAGPSRDETGTMNRIKQARLWSWIGESFINRRPLTGPQQYIRISVSLRENSLDKGDALLVDFLSLWLLPVDYRRELAQWRAR